jgi:signal transduction histidine kinase
MVLPEEVLTENQQLLSIANSNCDHLQLMVESMLDVSRMQNGKLQINYRSVTVKSLVLEAVKRVQILADMENIFIDLQLPDNDIVIEADEEKLYRVMGNLLNNAIKYTPTGGQILVAIEPKNDDIWLSVVDTGPGIPPESRERVFDRFSQLNDDGPRLRSGFGLGLSFCRIAVEAHQGKIWVEPGENDTGSRFVVSLPQAAPKMARIRQ